MVGTLTGAATDVERERPIPIRSYLGIIKVEIAFW